MQKVRSFLAIWICDNDVHNILGFVKPQDAAKQAVEWVETLRREGMKVTLQREQDEIQSELELGENVEVLIEGKHRILAQPLEYYTETIILSDSLGAGART